MLRKGVVALMVSIMSVSSLQAADEQASSGLISFLKGPAIGRPDRRDDKPSGVTHAVVNDAERQVPEIRQTSGGPSGPELLPAESAPQPLPVQFTPAASHYPSAGPTPVSWQSYGAPAQYGGPVSYGPSYGSYPANVPGPLYPAPKPGISHRIGGTAIVHQALHPHEMLYPHRYKAMYGPFYYRVHGGWIVTPFGVWSKEHWKLQGTTVDVKYKSHISKFSGFNPPVIR